jgi:V/A-type H+/Na+-transporting ATPase subunit E
MEYEDLIKSMEAGAEKKRLEITERTKKATDAIIRDAQLRAENIKKSCLESALREALAERNKKLYLVRNNAAVRIISLKREYFDRAFSGSLKELENLRSSQEYPGHFKNLLLEASDALAEARPSLHVDKKDEELCRKTAGDLGLDCEIVADITCSGGVIFSREDGSVVVYNDIGSRIERAKEMLKLKVFDILGR